jgi:hypothetical protein
MATWESLRDRLRLLRPAREEPEWIGLVWRTLDGPQKVRVDRVQDEMIARAEVCFEEQLLARDALVLNAELPAGALALSDGLYVVRYLAPLAVMRVDALLVALDRIAAVAASLRARVTRPPCDPALYAAYRD